MSPNDLGLEVIGNVIFSMRVKKTRRKTRRSMERLLRRVVGAVVVELNGL